MTLYALGAPLTHNSRDKIMPYINIKITDENVTTEQKQALIKGTTQLMVDVLNKDPATTFVVIDEVNLDNWGIGYEQVTELRKRSI
jgi:4-oxalocrotonate tautomerase